MTGNAATYQNAMEDAFHGLLGKLTVPNDKRSFATKDAVPGYAEKIAALKKGGAELVVVFDFGRVLHLAFWEPHFGGEFKTDEE